MRKGKVGTRLRALREAAGLRLAACAQAAKINKGSLLHIERGDRPIPGRYVGRLAKVLGPEVEVLARPGQLALALNWTRAERRFDLDTEARRWLADLAKLNKLSLNGETVETWEIPTARGRVFALAVEAPAVPA